jgi:TPP-dependent pyruvate/acetoin dehydrogenase alpha subunit
MVLDLKRLIDLYKTMLLVRRFEEKMVELYEEGYIPGALHLGIGHEALSVGACAPLREDDYLLFSHRGFGHCIAKGMPPGKILAEFMGKRSGCSGGKGGVHLADYSLGILGISGSQGGNHVIATGAGLSAQLRGTDQVTACFFGDGTANRGTFLEGINMTAVWKLPVLFICENNLYGFSTAQSRSMVVEDVAARAPGLGIPGEVVDGNDAIAVYEVVQKAIARARAGDGPSLIEGKTYRWRGHHEWDPGTAYRSQEEMAAWKEKCPIHRLETRLVEMGAMDRDSVAEMEKEVAQEVAAAVEFAMGSPEPLPTDLLAGVYA